MNAATNVKRHKLTQEDCDIARFFTRRGMKLKEIGKIIGVDPSTVGKIQKADFRLETYLEQRKEMNRKTAENKAREEEGRRRLNALLDPIVDEERDKLILDQLVEEREAEKNGMTVEMYRFCKKMREKQDEPAEVKRSLCPETAKLRCLTWKVGKRLDTVCLTVPCYWSMSALKPRKAKGWSNGILTLCPLSPNFRARSILSI